MEVFHGSSDLTFDLHQGLPVFQGGGEIGDIVAVHFRFVEIAFHRHPCNEITQVVEGGIAHGKIMVQPALGCLNDELIEFHGLRVEADPCFQGVDPEAAAFDRTELGEGSDRIIVPADIFEVACNVTEVDVEAVEIAFFRY